MHYCQKFAIVHVIVLFCRVEGLQVISNCLEFAPIVPLIQDCSQHILRGIHLQLEWLLVIRSLKYWVTGDYRLEFANCVCAFWSSHKGYILLGKVLNRADYLSIPTDKGAIITKQSQCAPDIVHIIKYLLSSCQAIVLRWVDINDSSFNPDPQVVHCSLMEGALA